MNNEKDKTSNLLMFYVHQDKLMWNRVQTLGVIQIATLAAAYRLSDAKRLALLVILLGFFLTIVVFVLALLDRYIRDQAESGLRDCEIKRVLQTEWPWLGLLLLSLAVISLACADLILLCEITVDGNVSWLLYVYVVLVAFLILLAVVITFWWHKWSRKRLQLFEATGDNPGTR